MKKSELPPDIEGIREMVAQFLYEQRFSEQRFDGSLEKRDDIVKNLWLQEASRLLSKLTELGAVLLDDDQTLPRRPLSKEEYHNASPLFEEAALERMKSRGWHKVVNLDGTPVKEG